MKAWVFILFLFASVPGMAQGDGLYLSSPFADIEYTESDMQGFSKLFWAMNMLDIRNDTHIDNYMLINECEIHTELFTREFEWREARAAAREHIRRKRSSFSDHLEFMQPLKLGEYDFENGSFEVLEGFQVKNMRRFEVVVPPAQLRAVCLKQGQIEGYPKALALKFSRPFTLTEIPVSELIAKDYVAETLRKFRRFEGVYQSRERTHNKRDAYIVYKTKILGHKGVDTSAFEYDRANFIALLQGVEIYADRDKTKLLYYRDFRTRKGDKKAE